MGTVRFLPHSALSGLKNPGGASCGISMTAKEVIQQLQGGELSRDAVNWRAISCEQFLTEDFIREFADQVVWSRISHYQRLTEDFIREFADRVRWDRISSAQHLTEGFIREFADRVDWTRISLCQPLTESFIREFADRVDWCMISYYQYLTEDFIREFADRVNWRLISGYQPLTEDFIRKFADKVDWKEVSAHQYLTEGFIQEYSALLDWDAINDNWLYKNASELEEAVRRTGLYECHKDFFIAYKNIRDDRYDNFNFQYRYMPGETYETFADTFGAEDPFGFSVWTKKEIALFSGGLTVACKVYYCDVARVVHDGGKIRCRKITILD